jgi:hypothetical protein
MTFGLASAATLAARLAGIGVKRHRGATAPPTAATTGAST